MSLFIASLNSGSNGNCYYIGNENEAVLVDAGLSLRDTKLRMQRLGLSLDKIKGIFISHEHTDHIKGLAAIAGKHSLPVFATPATLKALPLYQYRYLAVAMEADTSVQIGALHVTSFSKHHDAADPVSFTVRGNDVTIGVFTDIGKVCSRLTEHFSSCHAAFLEANYDAAMLEAGRYPYFLKNRIRGGKGHLSNDEAFQLFRDHAHQDLKLLLLSHLSKDNNDPELAVQTFCALTQNTEIKVASRYAETDLFEICRQQSPALQLRTAQLALF